MLNIKEEIILLGSYTFTMKKIQRKIILTILWQVGDY